MRAAQRSFAVDLSAQAKDGQTINMSLSDDVNLSNS